jgi:hypothetical protein
VLNAEEGSSEGPVSLNVSRLVRSTPYHRRLDSPVLIGVALLVPRSYRPLGLLVVVRAGGRGLGGFQQAQGESQGRTSGCGCG